MGFRSSQVGLELIDKARLSKGFSNKYGENWAIAAFTTPSTLKRFWQRKAIQPTAFTGICQAVGCDWHDIVEASSFEVNQDYVRRPPVEIECHAELRKPRALIRIKAPRRMGKTALIAEIVGCGQRLGHTTIRLNMLQIDESMIDQPRQVMQWFCRNVYRQIRGAECNLDALVKAAWDGAYGNNDNCTIFFEQHVLDRTDTPIVLAIDNLDRIFAHRESAVDFLGLLRSWHEDNSSTWKKLRLVLAHSTELYPTLDVESSPFNVGKAVSLSEFTLEQVQEFLTIHQVTWPSADIEQLMALVGGYPELIAIAVNYRKMNPSISIQTLIEIATTVDGPYRNCLSNLYHQLAQHRSLLSVVEQLVQAREPIALSRRTAFYLDSLGLVKLQGEHAKIRNQLYRQFFQRCLEKQRSA